MKKGSLEHLQIIEQQQQQQQQKPGIKHEVVNHLRILYGITFFPQNLHL